MRRVNLWIPGLLLTVAWLTAAFTSAAEPPRLAPPAPTPAGLNLSWSPSAGDFHYLVQRRRTLAAGLWITPRGAAPFPISDSSWLDESADEAPLGFYRVLAVPAYPRSELVSAAPIRQVSKFEISLALARLGVQLTPQYEVQLYRILYLTPDAHGRRNEASGLLAVPVNATKPLPLVSYQHGTIIQKNEAPSSATANPNELYVGVVFAATGYLAVLPDYVGLGSSSGPHPYHHAASEATAGVDLLRAARRFCASNGLPWNQQLFLCGYSQGGHAAAALQRELEQYHANEFTVTASALMAGAYDLSGVTAQDMLSGRPQPNPYYFAFLLAAFQEIYALAPTLRDLLAAPYRDTLPPLLDGAHGSAEINAAMTNTPSLILDPGYLAAYRTDPRHPLRLALEDNDLIQWRPMAPTRLYHCSGDIDVLPANSQIAHERFISQGASVDLIDPSPGADHGGCAVPALLAAKQWFDSLKQ